MLIENNNGVKVMGKDKVIELWKRYKAVILYLIFGGITTIINILTYAIGYQILGLGNVMSNTIAWLFAVIIAYITNKLWVFESRSLNNKNLVHELMSFFSCRIITGGIDLIIMYVSVDRMHFNPIIMKIVANFIVIVSNYFASKYLIFNRKYDGKN